MAAITLIPYIRRARPRTAQEPFSPLSSKCFDAFVSTRMRQAAAEASMRAPAAPGHVITIDKRTMIAMQMTSPDASRRRTPRRSTAATSKTVTLRHLAGRRARNRHCAIFSHSIPALSARLIPAFFIGRNKDGFWVAREVKGRIGGLFLLKNSALSFARRNSSREDAQPSFYPSG